MLRSCPGASVVKALKPYDVTCPHCGTEAEVWSDELRARCPTCHAWVYRERGATCLDWCAKAKECVGAAALAAYRRGSAEP